MSETDRVKRIKELLKLPQSLCNMCGSCCKIATFKGGLSYEQIIELINNPESEPSQVDGAKDFLTIFEPHYTHDDIKKIAPEFYDRVMQQVGKPNMSFFKCKFIGKHGGCLIHEDRPVLCRMYPVPHERTMFFPGCGFEKQSKANWEEIKQIIKDMEAEMAQTNPQNQQNQEKKD